MTGMNDDLSNSILDETRTLLRKQQTQLEDALQRVREAQEALNTSREIEGTTHGDAPATSDDKPHKRHMSAAAREAASKRMKAYWRKRRKAAKA